MNFISCAKWIRKGVAKGNPEKVRLTQEELQRVINSTREDIKELEDGEDAPMEEETEATSSNSDKYNFKDYDKEEEAASKLFGLGNIVVKSEDDDYKLDDDDYDSEDEDDKINPTDNLVAVGHIEGDACVLEIYVYNEDGDFYVHHDIILPSVPLCLEWLSYDPSDSKPGNLLAVGSMSCVIGVWDLDVVDCLEPAYLLGKYSVKKKHNKSHGHKDAVLDLAWNTGYHHILASGSVDKTVLLWDLDSGKASTTFAEFNDKVQSINWRPHDNHLLAAGSGDQTAKLFDCRLTDVARKWKFHEEIEKVTWCPWDNNLLYFGTNSGNVFCYDIRQKKKKVWEICAHEKEITALETDINCPNILVTGSMDEMVKIWDIENNPPILKGAKTFGVDELQCIDLNPDCPYVACIGGTKKSNNFKVVDLRRVMLQETTEIIANTMPVTFGEESDYQSGEQALHAAEKAFTSLSITSKKFKSKKKFGHKFKN